MSSPCTNSTSATLVRLKAGPTISAVAVSVMVTFCPLAVKRSAPVLTRSVPGALPGTSAATAVTRTTIWSSAFTRLSGTLMMSPWKAKKTVLFTTVMIGAPSGPVGSPVPSAPKMFAPIERRLALT